MLYFVFLVLLSSISTPVVVNALSCATGCTFTGSLGAVTPPACTYVNKPTSEQSCQVGMTIDYMTGAVNGILNAKTPASVANFDAVTVFSLAKEAVNLTIQFDCLDSDECDLAFVTNVLNSDWSKVLSQVKPLRNYLSQLLFNPSDIRPTETCPSNQTCSGTGFCRTVYQVWSDVPNPVYQGLCSNSTDQPLLDWVQAYDQSKVGILMIYTCNTPSCGASSSAANLTNEIIRDYVLPFNVTMPSTSTVAPATSTATIAPTGSTTVTVSTGSSSTTAVPTGSPTTVTVPTGSTTATATATVSTGSTTATATAPTASTSTSSTTMTRAPSTGNAAFLDKIVQVVSLFASFLFLYFS